MPAYDPRKSVGVSNDNLIAVEQRRTLNIHHFEVTRIRPVYVLKQAFGRPAVYPLERIHALPLSLRFDWHGSNF